MKRIRRILLLQLTEKVLMLLRVIERQEISPGAGSDEEQGITSIHISWEEHALRR